MRNLEKLKNYSFVLGLIIVLVIASCKGSDEKVIAENISSKAKVTFIELGSVNCIPCRQMQPVMKAVEKKYGEQISVVFYDVWKPDQKKYASIFGIKLIPTQIFLDETGQEFFRHEGFFPEAEIDKILMNKGLKPIE